MPHNTHVTLTMHDAHTVAEVAAEQLYVAALLQVLRIRFWLRAMVRPVRAHHTATPPNV